MPPELKQTDRRFSGIGCCGFICFWWWGSSAPQKQEVLSQSGLQLKWPVWFQAVPVHLFQIEMVAKITGLDFTCPWGPNHFSGYLCFCHFPVYSMTCAMWCFGGKICLFGNDCLQSAYSAVSCLMTFYHVLFQRRNQNGGCHCELHANCFSWIIMFHFLHSPQLRVTFWQLLNEG